jgi:hypothetical protein
VGSADTANVAVTVSGKVTAATRLTVGSVQAAVEVETATGELSREITGQQIVGLLAFR